LQLHNQLFLLFPSFTVSHDHSKPISGSTFESESGVGIESDTDSASDFDLNDDANDTEDDATNEEISNQSMTNDGIQSAHDETYHGFKFFESFESSSAPSAVGDVVLSPSSSLSKLELGQGNERIAPIGRNQLGRDYVKSNKVNCNDDNDDDEIPCPRRTARRMRERNERGCELELGVKENPLLSLRRSTDAYIIDESTQDTTFNDQEEEEVQENRNAINRITSSSSAGSLGVRRSCSFLDLLNKENDDDNDDSAGNESNSDHDSRPCTPEKVGNSPQQVTPLRPHTSPCFDGEENSRFDGTHSYASSENGMTPTSAKKPCWSKVSQQASPCFIKRSMNFSESISCHDGDDSNEVNAEGETIDISNSTEDEQKKIYSTLSNESASVAVDDEVVVPSARCEFFTSTRPKSSFTFSTNVFSPPTLSIDAIANNDSTNVDLSHNLTNNNNNNNISSNSSVPQKFGSIPELHFSPVTEKRQRSFSSQSQPQPEPHFFLLPVVDGNQIVPSVFISAIDSGKYRRVIIFDCRYDYEHNGGHIIGAINLFGDPDTVKQIMIDTLLSGDEIYSAGNKDVLIVFHCEFSQKRGPTLCREFNTLQRQLGKTGIENGRVYDEVYILNKGYSRFFLEYKVCLFVCF